MTPLKDIKPYQKNAKKHPTKQVRQIAASIKEFGFNQPIVVDENNEIIVGHGRYEAARLLGLVEVPTLTVKLTSPQVKAYRLADNKLNESEWDMALVIEELKGLSAPLLDLTGFDKDLILDSDAKDDEVPETPETPRSKLGDLYELGPHRVLCGDSTSSEAVLRLMDGKKADMVFTDPPYGLGGYAGRSGKFEGIKGDDGSEDLLKKFYVDAIPNVTERYIWGNWRTIFYLGEFPRDVTVWNKGSIGMGKGYRGQYEICFYFGKFAGSDSDVWDVKRDAVDSYKHPTQKPVYLGERAMLNSSERDSIIYDAFLGSGSTLIAAQKTGRICYGMELDPKYVDVIVQRYVDYTANNMVKLNGTEITWKK